MIITRNGKELPQGVARIEKSILGEYKQILWRDIFAKRKANQEASLKFKRRPAEQNKPCYIWVFNNTGWLFSGWFIYIKTLDNDYALNSVPLGILPLAEKFESWAEEFSKIYAHKGFKRNNDQGILKARCILKAGRVEKIII